MSSIRRSVWYSFADNHLGMLLQLVGSMVIARLLTPEEIGIYAVAAVFAALASSFRDFGITEYLIQEKQLTSNKLRAAFGVNLMVSWFIAFVLMLASEPVATFYGQPGVSNVMRVQAFNFILIPFGAISMAYHRRNLNYKPLFLAGLSANGTGLIVAIGCVLNGLSYMSMAWSSLASAVVFLGVAIIYRPAELPRRPSLKGIADPLRFGWHAVNIYLLGQLGKSAPEAIIGRALDMPSVAFFSRADSLVEIFRRAILTTAGRVSLPYFSNAARDGSSIANSYIRSVGLMVCIGWPFLSCVAIAAESIIRLLYGPQWERSIPLAHIICAAAIIRLPYSMATEAIIAAGNINQSNKLQWLSQITLLACLGLIIPFGLEGACWGILLSTIINSTLSQLFLERFVGVDIRMIGRTYGSASIVTILTALPTTGLALVADQGLGYYWFAPLASLLSLCCWFLALKITKHPLFSEIKRAQIYLFIKRHKQN